ncbi:MAG: pantoate--beta-alanine ligase [Hyphomicrobiales bacterium]|nr:pantoate--beta-alanine ligase [Hyphomicrobiales bacterium]
MIDPPDLPVTSVPVDSTVALIRGRTNAWRRRDETTALVTTMGALHEGHLSLVSAAREKAERVVVSVFVNPTQFAPNEDFDAYPRDNASDLSKLASLNVDTVFMPTVAEMYSPNAATTVSVSGPALGLETDFRPHFFRGVATVVAKLFLAVAADFALFGEKDYQQLLVVRRMATDLAIPITVLGCPTVREPDGLALSSRNSYLSQDERQTAPHLYRTLQNTADAIRSRRDVSDALTAGYTALATSGFKVDYLALRNADTLAEVTDISREPLRLLVAAHLGTTRLIDNIAVET